MKKITIGIIVILVLAIVGIALGIYIKSNIISAKCEGYKEVGEFDQKITSDTEAKQIAADYYKSIGYDFGLENLSAQKDGGNWLVFPPISALSNLDKLCVGSASPPECLGENLKLEERWFGRNKILKEYQIAC